MNSTLTGPGDIQYARTSDGIDIAYMVFGEGPDLLVAPGFVTHLDLMWDLPPFQALKSLGQMFRIIVLDKRGTGLSDRSLGFGSLENRTEDIRAVLDAIGSEEVILYGISESGPMCSYYAAKNPDRVRALILYGTFGGIEPLNDMAPDRVQSCWASRLLSQGLDSPLMEMSNNWGRGDEYQIFMSHPPDSEAARRVLARYERGSCTPQMAREIMQRNFAIDIRPFLPMIAVPTLVVHCDKDPVLPVESGRALAHTIPNASYVEIDGDFHGSWRREDNEKIGAAVAPFLAKVLGKGGAVTESETQRELATVLFTDIVSSTEMASEVGDKVWRSMLDDHDNHSRALISQHGGRLVELTGDGVLATFSGPSQAVAAAKSMQEAVLSIGVGLRAGIHTGEIELRGNRIGGVGVHIASRVMSFAGSGEICVSRTVRDLAVGSKLNFEDRGSHELKGISEPWQIFSVGRS